MEIEAWRELAETLEAIGEEKSLLKTEEDGPKADEAVMNGHTPSSTSEMST